MLPILRSRRLPPVRSSLDRGAPPVWGPLVVLLAGTFWFRFTASDLALSECFYAGPPGGWPLLERQPWVGIYELGVIPGVCLGLGGLVAWLAGACSARCSAWRAPGAFLFLLLAIGPGLLVNLGLKENWGRPRPNQIVDFGGESRFLPVGDLAPDGDGRSFPSGHAAMGFYLMAPGFLLYRRHPRTARLFFWIGLGAGLVLGATRVVQGRHFASDVLWSAGTVYFTGLALLAVFHRGSRLGRVRIPDAALEPAG